MHPASIPGVGMRRLGATLALLLWLVATPGRAAEPGADLFEKSMQAAVEAVQVYGAWDDSAQMRRVADVGYRVAQASGFREFPISFYLLDLPEPNAFALPAGQVFVTRGILSLGLTDDELAALLGHEIAHVVKRHGVRMERRATLLNVLSQAALIGVVLNADRQRSTHAGQLPYPLNVDTQQQQTGDLITGTYAAGLILSELLLRSYSREFEDEADEAGQRWAADAGFAQDGTENLMAVLGSRLPDDQEYGYWRTHPFFAQRLAAARIRSQPLGRGIPRVTDEFRSWSQKRLLELGSTIKEAKVPPQPAGRPPAEPPGTEGKEGPRPPGGLTSAARLVESAALNAWPKGVEAERLRLDRLHRLRDETMSRVPISRDFGQTLKAYDREVEEVAAIDASSPLLPTLREEREALAKENIELLPQARGVWSEGVYETGFLETFLSNWPDDPAVPSVALALAESYSRTGRQADAVELFLRAERSESPDAEKARLGLRNLAPDLDQLTALAELANQTQDPELAAAAAKRLDAVVSTYGDIAAGAAYLTRFPGGPHSDVVTARLHLLAENLYGEVLLYQSLGDHVKAIERIQKILTYAPTSPAAQKLLEKVVLPA